MSAAAYSLAEAVEAVVREHGGKIGALMPVLHGLQARMGYIPADAIPLIARAMNLSRAEVHGVVHFYHDFRSEPPGEHVIQMCRGEACQAMGSRALEEHVKRKLKTGFGETSANGRYTLLPGYCFGNCACTPTVRIDDAFHARVTPERFDALLAELDEGRS